jgi:hypothetical protein
MCKYLQYKNRVVRNYWNGVKIGQIGTLNPSQITGMRHLPLLPDRVPTTANTIGFSNPPAQGRGAGDGRM